jgi:hypothetical protein
LFNAGFGLTALQNFCADGRETLAMQSGPELRFLVGRVVDLSLRSYGVRLWRGNIEEFQAGLIPCEEGRLSAVKSFKAAGCRAAGCFLRSVRGRKCSKEKKCDHRQKNNPESR